MAELDAEVDAMAEDVAALKAMSAAGPARPSRAVDAAGLRQRDGVARVGDRLLARAAG